MAGNNDSHEANGSLSAMNLKTSKHETVGSCDANFFNANNKNALKVREEVAERALIDILKWINIQKHSSNEAVNDDCS